VEIQLQEDREETEEINKRATNIIIHGMTEPDINSTDTKNKEENRINTLLHGLKCDEAINRWSSIIHQAVENCLGISCAKR